MITALKVMTRYRIRMNDNYSVSVSAEFYLNKLINIQYDVVKQNPEDNYAILNFSNDESEPSQVLIINKNYRSNHDEIISALNVGGTVVGYDCSCKSKDVDGISDCQVRRYYNEVYCDGNWCQYCSLKINFKTGGDHNFIENISIIIFPTSNL